MRFSQAVRAIPRRLTHPWIIALILGMYAFRMASLAVRETHFLMPGTVLHPFLSWFANVMPPMEGALTPINLAVQAVTLVYLFALSPLPWQWTGDERRVAPILRGLILATGFYVICGLPRILFQESMPAALQLKPWASSPISLLLTMVVRSGLPTLVGYILATLEAHRAEKDEAHAQADEARWNLLKAQMSPHVLLNSLTGLAEMVRQDPMAAKKGMEDLADIYGRLLTYGEVLQAPLFQERRLLEQYLRIEQMRLGPKLQVRWEWDPAVDEVPALPLLLQPLVENALKFGPGADPAGGEVLIRAQTKEGRLHLAVGNTDSRRPARPGTGFGLRNLKARLELTYGSGTEVRLRSTEGWTYAELDLPVEDMA